MLLTTMKGSELPFNRSFKNMRIILKAWYKLIKKNPGDMNMVRYWKTKDFVEAKLTKKDGATIMVMEGEDYPMWGFPRGHLLIPANEKYGPLSILKHEIKNKVFNEVFDCLQTGSKQESIELGKKNLKDCYRFLEPLRYDLMPPQTMCPAVREIHRALTKVGCPNDLRDILCLILQEDDGYRYRVQWLAIWIPLIRWNPIKIFEKGLKMIERAEIIGDMKRKVKLLRTILMLALEDKRIKEMFIKFFKEVNWRKVRITEGDRYHMRGKYFKADLYVLEY